MLRRRRESNAQQVPELAAGPLYRQPVQRERDVLEALKREFI